VFIEVKSWLKCRSVELSFSVLRTHVVASLVRTPRVESCTTNSHMVVGYETQRQFAFGYIKILIVK